VSTPEDLEFRGHLRNEIMRAGMYDVTDVSIYLNYTNINIFKILNLVLYITEFRKRLQ